MGLNLHQIAEEIMLLVNNVCEKNITDSQNKQNFESVGMLSVICLCYNFALVLQENAHVFSQSKAHNFSTYIIRYS